MKAKILLLEVLIVTIISLTGCTTKTPSKINVDGNVVAAVYSVSDTVNSAIATTECLLEETVHITELLQYPHDEQITMPFHFTDTTKYAEITGENIGKRIAIGINGHIVSTPVVKMKISNGACSVTIPESQILPAKPTMGGLHTRRPVRKSKKP